MYYFESIGSPNASGLFVPCWDSRNRVSGTECQFFWMNNWLAIMLSWGTTLKCQCCINIINNIQKQTTNWEHYLQVLWTNTGSGTNSAPFYYKIFYYKIISMYFCNITISYSSIPYDILGEIFKLKYELLHPHYYPTNHTQAGITSAGPCISLTYWLIITIIIKISEINDTI